MCLCKDIEMGSYKNQTIVIAPFKQNPIGIDNCILEEVKSLWELGIVTMESCCGHNVAPGYIAVIGKHMPKMLELGYKQHPVWVDIFEPKTIYPGFALTH